MNLFLLLVINAAGQFDVSELDVCVRGHVKALFEIFTSGEGKGINDHALKKKKKDELK